MTDDRTLLENAADAAEIPAWQYETRNGMVWNKEKEVWHRAWNPLTDDGDALRLAVKLRMQIRVEDYGGAARIDDGGWSQCEAHLYGGIESATRRAIVRAAAAMADAT